MMKLSKTRFCLAALPRGLPCRRAMCQMNGLTYTPTENGVVSAGSHGLWRAGHWCAASGYACGPDGAAGSSDVCCPATARAWLWRRWWRDLLRSIRRADTVPVVILGRISDPRTGSAMTHQPRHYVAVVVLRQSAAAGKASLTPNNSPSGGQEG